MTDLPTRRCIDSQPLVKRWLRTPDLGMDIALLDMVKLQFDNSADLLIFPRRMNMLHRFAVAIAVVTLGSASIFAEPRTENLMIFRNIEKQIHRSTYFSIFDDVKVSIEDEGVVTLAGNVTMSIKRNEIAKHVEQVDGVTEVRNEIDVLPVSGFDDLLRYRLARAIYGNSMFRTYGTRFSLPIHIIVNRGHVTLTGVVDSNVHRVMVRSLAGRSGAFSVTNELRTPDEVEKELELLG